MIEYFLFVLGLIFLLKGADFLVQGSSSLAKKLGVPSLVIGLTVVAFGTSLPELVVNIIAAISGNAEIAFGNVVGSNLANLLLILGLTATVMSLKVEKSTIWKQLPFSLLAGIVVLLFSSTFYLDSLGLQYIYRFEGIILLLFFVIFLYYVYELSKGNRVLEDPKLKIKRDPYGKIILYIVVGLIGLYLGGEWTVNGAISIAKFFGMSEYFISLTIVAIGTSLPELITSIIAAIRKDVDLAVGNIIGSNIFNLFLVLGVSSVITPIAIPKFAIIDLCVLVFSSILLFSFMFIGKKHQVDRWQGITFVLMYVIFMYYVYVRSRVI